MSIRECINILYYHYNINNEFKVVKTIASIKLYSNYLNFKQCPKNMNKQNISIFYYLFYGQFV